MPEEKSTDVNEPKETPAVEAKPDTEEKAGLSRRDALQMAHERLQADKGESVPLPPETIEQKTPTGLEPPAEFNDEEKADFRALSPKQQEAQIRLLNSRKKFWEEGKQAREAAKAEREALAREKKEVEYAQRLAKNMEAYLRSRGAKGAPEEELLKAFEAIQELNSGDPRLAAAKFLEAKGVELSEEARAALLNGAEQAAVSDAQISPLRKELDEVKQKIATQERSQVESLTRSLWDTFAGEKNASGGSRYPDVAGDGESALRLARRIGSLVIDDTPLAKQFVATVRERIPGATPMQIMEEAYKFSGGRVDDSSAARTKDAKSHVKQANRAAASVSGSSAFRNQSGQVKKFATRRDALAAALAQIREREG